MLLAARSIPHDVQERSDGTAEIFVPEVEAADATRSLEAVSAAGGSSRVFDDLRPSPEHRAKRPARPLGVLKTLHRVLLFLAALPIFTLWQRHGDWSGTELFQAALISGVCAGTAQLFLLMHKQAEQKVRDWDAGQIVREPGVHAGRFSLFLRPFYVTNLLKHEDYSRGAAPILPSYHKAREFDFEEVLQEAIGTENLLIGLGSEAEAIGAGRASVPDAQWQEKLTALALHAKQIFVIPGSRPGILWEMKLLRDCKALGKTIFIAPAEPSDRAVAEELRNLWEKTRIAAAEIGLSLPANAAGMVFKLDDTGALSVSSPLSGLSPEAIDDTLTKLVAQPSSPKNYWTPLRVTVGACMIGGLALLIAWMMTYEPRNPSPDPTPGPRSIPPIQTRFDPPDWTQPHEAFEIAGLRVAVPSEFVPAPDAVEVVKRSLPDHEVLACFRGHYGHQEPILVMSQMAPDRAAGLRRKQRELMEAGVARMDALTDPLTLSEEEVVLTPESSYYEAQDDLWCMAVRKKSRFMTEWFEAGVASCTLKLPDRLVIVTTERLFPPEDIGKQKSFTAAVARKLLEDNRSPAGGS